MKKQKKISEKNILSKIKTDLLQKNYKPTTIKSYLFYLEKYLFFLNKKKISDENTSIKLFLKTQQKKSNQTKNLILNILSFYYKNFKKQTVSIIFFKTNTNKINTLNKKQFEKIIENTKNQKHCLIFLLSYGSGLKISEIIDIKVKNLQFENNIITLNNKSTKENRETILPQTIKNELKRFVAFKKMNDFVFINPQNKQLSIRSVEKAFTEALKRAKITKKITFQSLRHSFSKEMLERGIDEKQLQKILGHKNIRTTKKYKTSKPVQTLNIFSHLDQVSCET
ncbi:MAG: site-specific integrase [Candidatus Magasanikbacteria bacterium]